MEGPHGGAALCRSLTLARETFLLPTRVLPRPAADAVIKIVRALVRQLTLSLQPRLAGRCYGQAGDAVGAARHKDLQWPVCSRRRNSCALAEKKRAALRSLLAAQVGVDDLAMGTNLRRRSRC